MKYILLKIKVSIFSIFFSAIFITSLCAFQFGAGYNNGGVAIKTWWNDTIGSEISLSLGRVNSYDHGINIANSIGYSIYLTPIIWNQYNSGDYRLNFSVRMGYIRQVNEYLESYGDNVYQYDSRTLSFLEEIEVKVPFVEGLYVVYSVDIILSYSSTNLSNNDFWHCYLSAIDINNLGLIWYF